MSIITYFKRCERIFIVYKIIFELSSPICFIDKPLFDGLITYCYIKDKLGFVPRKINFSAEEIEQFNKEFELSKIPLKKHKDNYFLASYMQYDEEKAINFTSSWKKRWANKYDFLADFGKSKRAIEIDKGAFKSYDIPLNLYNLDSVWFFFDSDNVKEVENLIKKHLYGLGKKTSQGYGEIKNIELESINYDPFENIIRPVPLPKNITDFEKTTLMMENKLLICRYQPPYWSMVNSELCRIG